MGIYYSYWLQELSHKFICNFCDTMRKKGLSTVLRDFRELIKSNDIKSISFVGVPGFCQPFAELFAYVVKDIDSYFIPNGDYKNTKKIVLTDIGMQMEDYGVLDKNKVDVLILLGGLAMERFNIDEKDIKNLINDFSPKYTIGICFMNIFEKRNWTIDFDYLIDIYLEYEIK